LAYGTPPNESADDIVCRAASAVGFSYWWGHSCWCNDGCSPKYSCGKGGCSGSCPNCTHWGGYGADCSGLVNKSWQVPGPVSISGTCGHGPYVAASYKSSTSYWNVISRSNAGKADVLASSSHIVLIHYGDPWGSMMVYEAKGCSYGVVHNVRTCSSSYSAARRINIVNNSCGNGKCDNGESCKSCPKDCGKCCGNGKCDNGENCSTCPKDCGKCPYCGDKKCGNGENCSSCPEDCGSCCGNGKCAGEEDCASCPADCGACCPNGACDHGEDCASCPADCGPCNHPPEGALEVANCATISGWTRDPDVEWPIGVQILCDGALIAQISADQPHPAAPGHGFSLSVGHELKNSVVHTVDAIGLDDKGTLNTTLPGSGKVFLCRNGAHQEGIWTIEYLDSAGVDIVPASLDDLGFTSLLLDHPDGLPYPMSGIVSATARLTAPNFDRISWALLGGLSSPLYDTRILLDGAPAVAYGPDNFDFVPAILDTPAQWLRVEVRANQMDYDTTGRRLTMAGLTSRLHGWDIRYSFDSQGAIFDSDSPDRLIFLARDGSSDCAGFLSSSRTFHKPFSGVRFLSGSSSPVPPGSLPDTAVSTPEHLEVHTSECLSDGSCLLDDFPGSSLDVRLSCGESATFPQGSLHEVRDIRVFESILTTDNPWVLHRDRAWGTIPLVPSGTPSGLACRVQTEPTGYFPTGATTCEVSFPDMPADEISGTLSYLLPGECFRGFLTVDGKPVRSLLFGEETAPLQVPGPTSSFGLALVATDPCRDIDYDAFVEVSALSYLKGGWWTTPSTRYGGIEDLRTPGCGLEFRNLRWWGMSGSQAYGTLVVHRSFDPPVKGIRYALEHNFEAPHFSLRLLLDGKPAVVHPLTLPCSTEHELSHASFSEAAFQFSVDTQGVYPHRWSAVISNIEVLDPDAGWIPACDAPVFTSGDAVSQVEQVATGFDSDLQPSSGDRSPGCAYSRSASFPWLLLLLLLPLCGRGLSPGYHRKWNAGYLSVFPSNTSRRRRACKSGRSPVLTLRRP